MRAEAIRFKAEASDGSKSVDFVVITTDDVMIDSFQIPTELAERLFGIKLKPNARHLLYVVPKWRPRP